MRLFIVFYSIIALVSGVAHGQTPIVDPTQPMIGNRSAELNNRVSESAITLQAIVITDASKHVIIDGQVHHEDDVVSGNQIIEIKANSIVLMRRSSGRNEQREIFLHSSFDIKKNITDKF